MLLTRIGNKQSLSSEIYRYFPPHRMRITLFFGAGGIFFNTPLAEHNICNDLDDDVTNLYLVVLHQREALKQQILRMPISASLVRHWKSHWEVDPVLKAVRFLLLSNFTIYGKGHTLKLEVNRTKENLLRAIEPTFRKIQHCMFVNEDFRDVIGKVSFSKKKLTRDEAFLYLDPCYLDREHSYKVPKWKKDDTVDCLDIMANEGIPAAMSEFDHPFVLKEAKRRHFHILPIKRRTNLKRKDNEILITNYWPQGLLF
ncbi:MAG: DNA adenine methylase [Bacteroidota bacterium]